MMAEICPDGGFYGCEMQLKYNQCRDTCPLLPNKSVGTGAVTQDAKERRDDKAMLIMNLRAEREKMIRMLPRKKGIMFSLACEYIDQKARQIRMVRELQCPLKP